MLRKWGTKWSLWPVHLVTACCGVELAHTYACGYDAERIGSLNYGICRQTNLIIVEGAITKKMARVLRITWEQMPNPKFVIVMGACGIKGGIFWNSYHMVRPWEVVPVDVFVPGCPPTPEALIRGIVSLQKKIEGKKDFDKFEEVKIRFERGKVRSVAPLKEYIVENPAILPNAERGRDYYSKLLEDLLNTRVYTLEENLHYYVFVEDFRRSAQVLKKLGFDNVKNVNVIDIPHENSFMVEFTLHNYNDYKFVTLSKRIDRENPRIESLSEIFPSADYLEREMQDFFGISFEGNSWKSSFIIDPTVKSPLRKDFKVEEQSISEEKQFLQSFDWKLDVTKIEGDRILIVGPQHPGSGHIRLIVKLNGDTIEDIVPDPGYVHRGVEKLAETRIYLKNIPLVERPSIMDFANYDICYVNIIEKALGIEVDERAKYIRTVLAELCRIGTHLYDAGILSIFLGHSTGFMWAFGLREFICEALTIMTGARVTGSFIVPGGLRRDISDEKMRNVRDIILSMRKRLKKFEKIFVRNPTVLARLENVGVIESKEAREIGIVGPFLRASNVMHDWRLKGYEAYESVEWEVVTAEEGDSYARLLVRVEEINQSINIIDQLIRDLPSGHASVDLWSLTDIVLPLGEYISCVEGARGTIFMSILSDGESNVPYRFRMITPSWYNLRGFIEACKGEKLADLQAIYGSFGYFPPEADR